MVKFINIDGQLSTVLDMKETQTLILALEDLEYLQTKTQSCGTEDQKEILKILRSGPTHGLTNRNT